MKGVGERKMTKTGGRHDRELEERKTEKSG